MVRLSIIIVNYNVKYFLEQALHSVRHATKNINAEVIVVDNCSTDGSVDIVEQKFPEVHVIANSTNLGFAGANNQGIKASSGEYVLLLNPDTVVEEDTFEKTLAFMDEHPDAGALGVKMLDGKGNFLPESKRAFPTPAVSFYKIFGLSALFPQSPVFSRYHLGYLDKDTIHEVEVLAGAFMLIRRKVLEDIGYLDETYFMYGEDIDLSYRIQQAGYKNYYFPGTRIIHYKGESTKKGSLNYVRMFYNAMIIFAQKHFSSGKASLYSNLIKAAITFRAGLTIMYRFVRTIALPLLDITLLYGGMYFIKEFWATRVKGAAEYYPEEYMLYIVPVYILIWTLTTYFSGGYDRPLRPSKVVRGVLVGTLIIAAMYAFLDESLRFSRAMIVLGAAWAGIEMVGIRLLINFVTKGHLGLEERQESRMVIAGSAAEGKRALNLMNQAGVENRFMGFVASATQSTEQDEILGTIDELQDIVEVFGIDEVVFCSQDISSQQIIEWMTRLGSGVHYKIVPEQGLSIIGSNSKNTAGDLYAIDINLALNAKMSRRNKRLFDLLFCTFLLLTFPITIWLIRSKTGLLTNWLAVVIGQKTWVGYAHDANADELPAIQKGVLSPLDRLRNRQVNSSTISRLNLLYAKDYTVYEDLEITQRGFAHLGRR